MSENSRLSEQVRLTSESPVAQKVPRQRVPFLGLTFVVIFLLTVVFGYWIAPYDYNYWDMGDANLPPAWVQGGSIKYLLGTDTLGRDLLSRIIHGARFSLLISVSCIAVYTAVGTLIGLVSGFIGGKTDMIIMRICDLWMGLPAIILAILLSSVLGPSAFTLILIIGLAGWPGIARIVRGECLSQSQNEYVKLAVVAGCSSFRIMFSHIFPNVANTLIVLITLSVGQVIILTATMSFLGLGTQPPATDWGLLMSEGRHFIGTAWWLVTFPGVAILLVVLGFNLVGDWLRDLLDPRQKLKQA
jgi:peptide/nickel transport system permease protein